jgi:hypothetical protein
VSLLARSRTSAPSKGAKAASGSATNRFGVPRRAASTFRWLSTSWRLPVTTPAITPNRSLGAVSSTRISCQPKLPLALAACSVV